MTVLLCECIVFTALFDALYAVCLSRVWSEVCWALSVWCYITAAASRLILAQLQQLSKPTYPFQRIILMRTEATLGL